MATYSVTVDGREFTIDANSPEEAAAKVSQQSADVETALKKEHQFGGATDVTKNLAEIPMRGGLAVAGYKGLGGPGILGKLMGGLGGATAATAQTPGEVAGLAAGGAAGKLGTAAIDASRTMRVPRLLQQLLAPVLGGAGYEASTAAQAAVDQRPFSELHNPNMLAFSTLFPYLAERFVASPVTKSPTAKSRDIAKTLTGQEVAPVRVPELTPEATVRPTYNRLESETVAPDTGAYPRYLQSQTQNLRRQGDLLRQQQATVKAEGAVAKAGQQERVAGMKPEEFAQATEKGKSLADLKNDVIDLRAALRVEPDPINRERIQMQIDDVRKTINSFGAEPVPAKEKIVEGMAKITTSGNKQQLADIGKQISSADVSAKRVDNLRKDFESFVKRSKNRGDVGVPPRLEKFGRAGSSEKFLDEVFHAPDEDFVELQKFLTSDERRSLTDSFGEWFLKKAYDAKTGTLAKALDVVESLGSSKIARLHGGDITAPRALYRLSQDLKVLSEARGASPTLTLTMLPNRKPGLVLRSIHGLSIGAPSSLHERMLQSPDFGEQFHQWALRGATQQSLESLPLIRQWIGSMHRVDAKDLADAR